MKNQILTNNVGVQIVTNKLHSYRSKIGQFWGLEDSQLSEQNHSSFVHRHHSNHQITTMYDPQLSSEITIDCLVQHPKHLDTAKIHQNTQLRFKPSCSTFYALIATYVCKIKAFDVVDIFDEMFKADVKANNEFTPQTLINDTSIPSVILCVHISPCYPIISTTPLTNEPLILYTCLNPNQLPV